VVVISLAIGIWATVIILAVNDTMHAESLRDGIDYKYSHIQIHHSEFKKKPKLKYTLPRATDMLEQITRDGEVEAATTRTLNFGMIATAGHSSNVFINGVLTEQEERTTLLKSRLSAGDYLDSPLRNPVIVGEKLMKKLKSGIGKKVVLTFENVNGDLVSTTFRIAGTYTAPHYRDEESIIFVKQKNLAALSGTPGQVHQIAIKLKDEDLLENYILRLRNRIDDMNIIVENWRDAAPELGMISDMIIQTDVIVTIIVMLALAFGIVNTMLMAVLERFKELGILMAIGMNKIRIFSMIILETILLSLLGGVIGMLTGFSTVKLFWFIGINMSRFSEGLSGWGFTEIVHPELELRVYIIITMAVIATAIFSAIYPAFKALSLKPVEAIRKDV
jgi:ABC-type lipoprotein release transport system permease subunit